MTLRQRIDQLLASVGTAGRRMLFAIARPLLWRVPQVRRPFWRLFYEFGTGVLDDEFRFLNLGALSERDHPIEDTPGITERLSERLYAQALATVDLRHKDVVEVGSGRGGGSEYIARVHVPRSVIGVDASGALVRWCRKRYDQEPPAFVRGDALALPFPSTSVDAVVNIESSHCYPSRGDFFREVSRVLRPGGQLVLADLLYPTPEGAAPEAIDALLAGAGLTSLSRRDITADVVRARRAVSESKAFRKRLDRNMPPWAQSTFLEGYCLVGSADFNDMAAGKLRYWLWTAEKSA